MRAKQKSISESDLKKQTLLFEANLETIRRAVCYRAAGSIRELGLSPDEKPDLEQECYLAVWVRLPQFDESRAGLATFIDKVARTTLSSIAKAARAAKRTSAGIPAQSTPHRSDYERQLDLRKLVASLSKSDRNICKLLAQYSRGEACRRSRLSRSSFYRAISRIRTAFVAAGMG